MRSLLPVVWRGLGAKVAPALAGSGAVSFVEAGQAMRYGTGALDALVAGALAAAVALPVVAVAVVAWAGLRRVPALARALAQRDEEVWAARLWGGALVGLGLAGLAAATYAAAKRVQVAFRFLDPAVAGLVLAAVVVVAAAALGGALGVVHRALGAQARRALARAGSALAARPRWRRAVWSAAAIAAALAPVMVARATVPALDLRPIVSASVVAVAALWAALTAAGSAWPVRGLALVVAGALVAAPWALAQRTGARRAAIEHGALGKRALRAWLALGDRDGDGHAAVAFGGADCDDRDAGRHPLVRERGGDGRDDNCNGADGAALVRAAPPLRERGARPNILLISIDALRADHLGAWGYRRPVSPTLDALAAAGARFSWAMTSCPSTRCAMPSLMTGRFASAIDRAAPPVTLATVLGAAGWQTAAITCCDRFLGATEEAGFAVVDTSAHPSRLARIGQSNSDLVVDAAARWLGQRRADAPPFFLWMHLYEPHHPYLAPEAPRQFGDSDLDRYDAEIRFVDAQLGRLRDTLAGAGLAEHTILAVTADHGDEFGEHGLRFHARSLYNQVVRVPLIVYVPPALGGRPTVVESPVSLVDVMPTLIDLAGAQVPAGLGGLSLADAVLGAGPAPQRPVLVELIPDRQIERNLVAVLWQGWKLIWDREANAVGLYELRDAHDAHERAAAEPTRVQALRQILAEALDGELGIPP